MAVSERGNSQPRPGLAESRREGDSTGGAGSRAPCPWGAGAWSRIGLTTTQAELPPLSCSQQSAVDLAMCLAVP